MESSVRDVGEDVVETIDRFVSHVSTVPAIKGQLVGLHLRERVLASVGHRLVAGGKSPVVLFIHGGYSPSVVAYDLDYKDYSFMAALARAGFDAFAMAHTGYGASPKPLMDDPCNVDASVQPWIIPQVLKEPSPPRYPYKLVSSRTEWDEIETVVRFIKKLRGVERVSLVGWSTGAPRAGGFAALHPASVEKLVLFGPSPYFASDEPPATMPEPGAPMILQSWDMLMNRRWQADVRCDGQIEDVEIRELMWRELMAADGLGAQWGRDGHGVMRAPNRMNFGWRANVAKIRAPTLILVGEFDNYEKRRDAWLGLRVEHKAFIKVACASHFVQYERGRHVLHRAAREWLTSGTIEGRTCAEFCADAGGRLTPLVE